jgi:hypothetical protein
MNKNIFVQSTGLQPSNLAETRFEVAKSVRGESIDAELTNNRARQQISPRPYMPQFSMHSLQCRKASQVHPNPTRFFPVPPHSMTRRLILFIAAGPAWAGGTKRKCLCSHLGNAAPERRGGAHHHDLAARRSVDYGV